MRIKQLKVDMNELSLGMFVSGLDRPWSQTPFPLQGFYLRDLEELNKLKSLCSYVFIDLEKGRGPISSRLIRRDAMPISGLKIVARESASTALTEPVSIRRSAVLKNLSLKKTPQKLYSQNWTLFLA